MSALTGAPEQEKMAWTERAFFVVKNCWRGRVESYAFRYWNLFEVNKCSPNIEKAAGFLRSSTSGGGGDGDESFANSFSFSFS